MLARQVVIVAIPLLVRLGPRGVVVPYAQRQTRVKVAIASAIAFDKPVEQNFEEMTV
ncbi:hypothetical protein D3C83_158630 [compost metagenome]